MMSYLLAIDQGTTNSRAILFNRDGELISQYEVPLSLFFPHDGWVEQDPEEMFTNTVTCCREVMKRASIKTNLIKAIGISNQRETTIIWDKQTGVPIYPAICWQDRRTSALCKDLAKTALAEQIPKKTGLLLDPYFSATKIVWILEHVPHAKEKALRQELLFGTVDTFLLWKLTNGKAHKTDASNASRTMLFNLHTQCWDSDILKAFAIPQTLLPEVLDNAAHFGDIHVDILGQSIPITGMAGDQQAATIGQACFSKGMVKATYGTGCFMLLNTGSQVIQSKHHLISTVAYRLNQQVTYGLEGSIFCAGLTVKWLRDTLKLIQTAAETEVLANAVKDTGGVYLVPAFTGLGAPYWDPEARGAILGLTRNSNREHIVRAALESVAYQTNDLLHAMLADSQTTLTTLRVDGGMTANRWLLQFLADILYVHVERPSCIETSAKGVAFLAGLYIGLYQSLDEISQLWRMEERFSSTMSASLRDQLYSGWLSAVSRVVSKEIRSSNTKHS